MLKLDSHQHFWDIRPFAYPWLSPAMTVLYRGFLPADLAPHLAASGIVGSYEQVRDLIAGFAAALSPSEPSDIWSGSARRGYGL